MQSVFGLAKINWAWTAPGPNQPLRDPRPFSLTSGFQPATLWPKVTTGRDEIHGALIGGAAAKRHSDGDAESPQNIRTMRHTKAFKKMIAAQVDAVMGGDTDFAVVNVNIPRKAGSMVKTMPGFSGPV